MNRPFMTAKIILIALPLALEAVYRFVETFWKHDISPGDAIQVKITITFGPKPERFGWRVPVFGEVSS